MGIAANAVTAYLVARVKIQNLAVGSALITMIAPPLMATVEIGENYWFAPFWALFLSPVNPDGMHKFTFHPHSITRSTNKSSVLFTVSNLVISDAFPPEVQSLAGGVFNEVSQFGNSVGLAVTAAIAASITDRSAEQRNEDALMKGYRAAFWTIFTGTVVVVVVSAFGLRHAGTVGKKND
jgi:MFS family permease